MKTGMVYNPAVSKYDFGQGHPFRGNRFGLFMDFFKERFGRFETQFVFIQPEKADDELLALVHTPEYRNALGILSQGEMIPAIGRFLSEDNLNSKEGTFPQGIEEGARYIVGSSVKAVELVVNNEFAKVVSVGGGLHHAKPAYGEGFCIYNDVAIAVKYVLRFSSMQKVLVIDTDAHAGNGTKEIFFFDPRVLFIDIHQDPATLYPATGYVDEIGEGEGRGFTVNLCMSPGAAQEAYKIVFEEVVFPLAEQFNPDLIIRYGGSDPHFLDPLTNLGLSLSGFRMIGRYIRELAQELTNGKVVDMLTSGYNLQVLPFAWSALIAGLVNGIVDLRVDLSGLVEDNAPSCGQEERATREMVDEVKRILKPYWSI